MRFGLSAAALIALGLASFSSRGLETPTESPVPQHAEIAPLPLTLDAPVMLAETAVKPAPLAGTPYRGGRGLITLQGMSGMFLNPTSGTLDQGQLTIQYCLLVNKFNFNTVVGHGMMALEPPAPKQSAESRLARSHGLPELTASWKFGHTHHGRNTDLASP